MSGAVKLDPLGNIVRMLWISELEILAWEIKELNRSREDRIYTYSAYMRMTIDDVETVH